MIHLRKYGVATEVYVPVITTGSADFKNTPTIAAGDFNIVLDGVSLGQMDTLPTIVPAGGYHIKIPLSIAETSGETAIITLIDAAGAEWEDQMVIVETYGNASARHPFDLGTATQDVNVTQVSGDSTAADNLESQYDTTGLAGDTFPATQAQVGNLTAGTAAINTTAEAFEKAGAEPETNTYTSTVSEDGTFHIVEDDGGATDCYYQFDVGGNGVPVSVTWVGYAQGPTDEYTLWAYNYGDTAYEQIGTINAVAGTTPSTNTYDLTSSHVGTTGADLGKVRFRFLSADGSAFATDRLLCSYAVVAQSVGYALGAIWVDSAGTAGSEVYVNGTADNPCPWANALVVSAALGVKRFHIANGNTVTLDANTDNHTLLGQEWTLALGGQSVDDAVFEGAHVTGTGTGTDETIFNDCDLASGATLTISAIEAHRCAIAGDIVLAAATSNFFDSCYSGVAGTGTPSLDFGAGVANTEVNFRHYSGGIEVKNIGDNGTDNMSLEGHGQLVLNANCDGGTIAIRGHFTVTDNVGGGFSGTISDDARYDVDQIENTVWDAVVADHLDAGSMGKEVDDLPHTGIFITGFTSSGAATNITHLDATETDTEPSDYVFTGGESDNDSITITAKIYPLGGVWQPASVDLYRDDVALTLDEARADWTQVNSDREYSVTFTVADASASATYHVQTSDGKVSNDFAYVRSAEPPVVSLAEWGQYVDPAWSATTYPTTVLGSQTAVKDGDTVDIKCTIDIDCDEIRVSGTAVDNQSFTAGYSAGIVYLEGVVVSNSTGTYQITVDARQTGGSYGVSDTTSNITLDQAGHTHDAAISNISHSLGGTYWALASGQNLTADFAITNWSAGNDGDVTYVASEVTISSDTEYAENKTYTYVTGTYRDSGTNVTLTSRRKANGKQTVKTYLVKIANTSPTLTMSDPGRFRSQKGADNTYGLTLTGSQELKDTPTCVRDATAPADDGPALSGAWTGSEPDKTWTHTVHIQEDDTKTTGADTYSWEGIAAENGAGKTVSSIATNPTYQVGGFLERSIEMPQFQKEAAIGTQVSNVDNAAKLTCEIWDSTNTSLTFTLSYVANATPNPGGRTFTISDGASGFQADGSDVLILDAQIYDVLDYYIRIEEDQ